MKVLKFNRLLFGIITCLFLLIALQSFWMKKQIEWQKASFSTLINTTLEKTIQQEKELRCDSVSNSIYRWLMDTTLTAVFSRTNEKYKTTVYYFEDKSGVNKKSSSFSLSYESRPILSGKIDVKENVVRKIVNDFRESYLNYQSIFYYTETVGNFASRLSDSLKLDSNRLTSIYQQKLQQEHVATDFGLHFIKRSDSIKFKEAGKEEALNVLQTRLFASDIYDNGDRLYVYALFKTPLEWLSLKLYIPLLLSIIVILIISALIIYLYRVINKQKALSMIKNDFIDNMTHELKTPITVISTAAEALQNFGAMEEEEKKQKYLGNIRNQAQQLQDIINKVLNISSYEKQEIRMEKTRVSLRNTVDDIVKNRLSLPDKALINTIVESPDDTIWADPFHLRNILLNCIENGIRYNEQVPAIIDIRLSSSDGYSKITISDNGIGIPKEHWPQLFEKFYRVPKGNLHLVKGYGLGLFYVKKIVEMHGGRISLDSQPGKGSHVFLFLPQEPK